MKVNDLIQINSEPCVYIKEYKYIFSTLMAQQRRVQEQVEEDADEDGYGGPLVVKRLEVLTRSYVDVLCPFAYSCMLRHFFVSVTPFLNDYALEWLCSI